MNNNLILIFLLSTLSILVIILSSSTVYVQTTNQTDFVDLEMNLILGKPIYVEKYAVSDKSINKVDNKPNKLAYSFSSNGTLNDIKVHVYGNGLSMTREDGTSLSNGRAFFTSIENGTASYSFQSIDYSKNDLTKYHGAAFFDSNATGNLEFLKSIVGVYKGQEDDNGIFVMWQFR